MVPSGVCWSQRSRLYGKEKLAPTTGNQSMAKLFNRVDVFAWLNGSHKAVWLGLPCVSNVYNSKQKGQSIQTITIIHAIIS